MEVVARTFTAFAGERQIASGALRDTVLATKHRIDDGEVGTILVFDDQSGQQVDFDFSGTPDEVLAKLADHPAFAVAQVPPVEPPGPGRPKLGVVSREVSLLPRHWEWLNRQPGGASATLRRLVEEAKKRGRTAELARNARDAAGKFMWAMAGNYPGFEEASRALYAKDRESLLNWIRDWPKDVRRYLEQMFEQYLSLDAVAVSEGSPAQNSKSL